MTVLDKFKLTDRIALVTGGNRGLGKQMARALAEAGASVALTSRDQARAEAAALDIMQTNSLVVEDSVRGYACDVSDMGNVLSHVGRYETPRLAAPMSQPLEENHTHCTHVP